MVAVMDRSQLLIDLEGDEGLRVLLYDDKTGKSLSHGSTIVGNPTLGIGWNVATTALTADQYRIILGWIVDARIAPLSAVLTWFSALTEPRQRAVANMAFQLGITGLLKFNTFLSLMEQGQYDQAATDLESTPWFSEVGERGPRIQAL